MAVTNINLITFDSERRSDKSLKKENFQIFEQINTDIMVFNSMLISQNYLRYINVTKIIEQSQNCRVAPKEKLILLTLYMWF